MPNLNLQPVVQRSMPLSMATEADLRFTAQQALEVIDRNVPGVFVECGVWRGGCSAAMLLAQRERHGRVMRKTYLLDSFQGLPPATERDGPFALAWQADTDHNCRASLSEVRAAIAALDTPAESYEFVPGWFDDTVPLLARRLAEERIALLRVDGDWYDSTAVCLEHLVPIVPEGGVVILDDYYVFDGCARATHDFSHATMCRIASAPCLVAWARISSSGRLAQLGRADLIRSACPGCAGGGDRVLT